MSSPPVIVRGVIVVGSSVMDWWGKLPSPPGDVRGFDVVTGKLLWTFHTVAQQGEPGVETWEQDSWKEAGNAKKSNDPTQGQKLLDLIGEIDTIFWETKK